jgi:hypothetical protein
VRIGEADDLPGIAWIGKNFLVTGEAGIENNFAAAARDGAGRTAVKYASVFERKDRRSMQNFRQCSLRKAPLFIARFSCGQGTEVVDRPIRENGAAVDKLICDRPKNPGIV